MKNGISLCSHRKAEIQSIESCRELKKFRSDPVQKLSGSDRNPKKIGLDFVGFLRQSPTTELIDLSRGNNDNFGDNSAISWSILLIFELRRDIDETILCVKFHFNQTTLSRVIV